jgi:hypothetical protein
MALQVKLKSRKLCNQTGIATNLTSKFRLAQTMARQVLEVFLSSTALDLAPYRDAVYARLAQIEIFRCVRQEDFGAQNAGAVTFCSEKAGAADLFVGLIGMRRGWEPDGDTRSPKSNTTAPRMQDGGVSFGCRQIASRSRATCMKAAPNTKGTLRFGRA